MVKPLSEPLARPLVGSLSNPSAFVVFSSASALYKRPGGTSYYRQPSGTDYYLRP